MDVFTDFPERLHPRVWVLVGPERHRLQIRTVRQHGQALLVAFRGIDNPEQAGALRNQEVFVLAEDRPALEAGEYYHHQLLGLKVYSEENSLLGTVIEILETGSNDVLVVRPPVGKDALLPFMDETLLEVNLEQGFLRMQVLPGLLDE
jgi:16S rRNA processing protein RimM